MDALTFILIAAVAVLFIALMLFWALQEHRKLKEPWNIPVVDEEVVSPDHSDFYCAKFKYGEIPGPCVTGQCDKCNVIEGYLAERPGETD